MARPRGGSTYEEQRKSNRDDWAAIGYCSAARRRSSGPGLRPQAIVGHSGMATSRPQAAKNSRQVWSTSARGPDHPPEAARASRTREGSGHRSESQLYGGAGPVSPTGADSRGMQGFYYHEATTGAWSAMVELVKRT